MFKQQEKNFKQKNTPAESQKKKLYFAKFTVLGAKATQEGKIMDFDDEIGELCNTINNMSSELEHMEKAKGVITYRRCKKLFFVCDGRIPFNVDGEIILMKDPEVKILEGAVNLVLPR